MVAFANSDSVWNKDIQVLVNGEVYSSEFITQGVLFLPDPGREDHIHLWNLITSCGNGTKCPSDYLIDLNAHNGSGEVLSLGLLGYPGTDNGFTERLNAVKHSDGKSWWVFFHDQENSDFYRYLMTAAGTGSPLSQSIGSIHGSQAPHHYGQIKFSHDGMRLMVVSAYGIVDVFEVDRCTGLLRNWIPLGDTLTGLHEVFYGCSFSPDGKKIYASTADTYYDTYFYQWDLTASNIPASKTIIYHDTLSPGWGQHQLGPDGKIYITQKDQIDSLSYANYALSVIADPDQAGLACNFQYLGLDLQGRRTSYNLPNLPNYNLGPLLAQTAEAGPLQAIICVGDSILIGYPDTTGGVVTYAWTGGNLADTTQPQQWVSPTQSTWYYLTVVDSAFGIPCGITRDSIFVIVADSSYFPIANAGADTTVCLGDSVLIGGAANPAWTYLWSPTGQDTSQITVSQPSTYTVIVRNPVAIGACLSDTDVVVVDTYATTMPQYLAGQDAILCPGDSVSVGGNVSAGLGYLWSAGVSPADTIPAWVSAVGTYVLSVYNPDSLGGCFVGMDTVQVMPFDSLLLPPGFAGADSIICRGDTLTLGTSLPSQWVGSWIPAGSLLHSDSLVSVALPTVTTAFVLAATDTSNHGSCATVLDTVLVIVEIPFVHPRPENQEFCPGEVLTVGVQPIGTFSYAWSPLFGLNDPFVSLTTVAPLEAIVYTLAVTSDMMVTEHCKTQYFPVILTSDGCIEQNVVTPNGDGFNDFLNLGSFNGPISLSVYDRWGAAIFSSNDYRGDWPRQDGRLPASVYYYVVKVAREGGKAFVGEITVLR